MVSSRVVKAGLMSTWRDRVCVCRERVAQQVVTVTTTVTGVYRTCVQAFKSDYGMGVLQEQTNLWHSLTELERCAPVRLTGPTLFTG